jgi:glucokinase
VRDGAILAARSILCDSAAGLADLLPQFKSTLADLGEQAQIDFAECASIVLGFCGIVSGREKRVLATNEKFDDAPKLNLAALFEDTFGCPFLLENDARLALLGEYRFGAARGAEDAVMITLGSGIGGAAMLNGKLLESRHGLAGTIGGHIPVTLKGRRCSCGNLGCAETEGSTSFLREIYNQQYGSAQGTLSGQRSLSFLELFDAMGRGDRAAVATFEHCLLAWSTLTVSLIHAYDPEVVVFGGAVLQREKDILPHLQDYVAAHAWTPGRTVPLRSAALGSDAALLGAIPLTESSL